MCPINIYSLNTDNKGPITFRQLEIPDKHKWGVRRERFAQSRKLSDVWKNTYGYVPSR